MVLVVEVVMVVLEEMDTMVKTLHAIRVALAEVMVVEEVTVVAEVMVAMAVMVDKYLLQLMKMTWIS